MGEKRSIIALHGSADSGKSTCARILGEVHGYTLRSFAYPLKAMLRTMLELQGASKGEIHELLYGKWKEYDHPYFGGSSARVEMQRLGDWGRDSYNGNKGHRWWKTFVV